MTALYLLTAEYKDAAERLQDADLPEEVIRDTLEAMTGEIEAKAQNVAFVIRNMEASAKAIREAAAGMLDRAKAEEKRADSIKRYLLENMMATGISKIECPYFKLSVRDNPQSVVIDDAEAIPDDYLREVPASYTLDKVMMKSAMQDGFVIPGAHLERGKRLEIK